MSEHRARPNDRGSGECLADCSLPGSLRTIELGCRGWRSVEVRYMHQPRNANARRNMGNAPGTIDMYVVISKISSGGRSQSALHRHEIMGRREREKTQTLSHNHDQRDCTQYRSAGHILQSVPRCECPIPTEQNNYSGRNFI